MIFYYGTEISPNQTETVEGFLICRNVPIARTGPMEYTAGELQLAGDPDRRVTVNRYEEDVFSPAALASFEGKSVTDGHPSEEVCPENYGAYEKGHAENIRREGDFMVADLYIKDPCLISDIKNGVKREVSCGYLCHYVPDGAGYKQQKIRGNHIAIVHRGRAGSAVSIKDASPEEKQEGGRSSMGKFAKEVLKVFGMAAKEATPEELDVMVDTATAALDAAPAEPKETPKEASAEDQVPEGGNGLEEKLDRVLALLEQALTKDEPQEKTLSDETDIDKLIGKMAGKTEGEASATVPAEEMEDKALCGDRAAMELLKKVRPAVAGIENREQRAKVTDALLSAFSDRGKVGQIMDAAAENAKKAADAAISYEDRCREQKAEYDKLNPHKNKEGK